MENPSICDMGFRHPEKSKVTPLEESLFGGTETVSVSGRANYTITCGQPGVLRKTDLDPWIIYKELRIGNETEVYAYAIMSERSWFGLWPHVAISWTYDEVDYVITGRKKYEAIMVKVAMEAVPVKTKPQCTKTGV